MEAEGVITKCDTSRWGTPLVPILKSDGGVRLCGDYKVTVNKNVKDVKHPLPTVDEIFAKLNGGQKFSKLDLSKCYNQFVLDRKSRELCAISTLKGVYLMNRLPFGVKPASGIVQKELEKLLCGIPGVQNFLDDVIVTGSSDEEHLERLKKVFQVLEAAGLKLNRDKCQFFKSELTFLGYVINKEGLKKTDERVRSIRDAAEPTNVTEVRAFAGLVNYYAKFIKNLADIMSPIYRLLRKGERFVWSPECSEAFARIKEEICKDISLVHFDPSAELFLTCDASNVGVSAVLSQRKGDGIERPVAFASRVIHASELNYSVIDKEALAIMYGVNKFFFYLAGNRFTIRTDHKPLLTLFHPHKGIPTIAASRMQRWAHFLSGFDYRIGHVKSELNIADFASRFPTESWKLWKEEDSYINFINQDDCGLVELEKLVEETEKDPELAEVKRVLSGRNKESQQCNGEYKRVLEELSLEKGAIMRGHRVVVPMVLRSSVLDQLHRSHLGIVKSKSIARSNVWWPGIDRDLESRVKNCTPCLMHSQSPPSAKLIPWKPAGRVWERVHVDFADPIKGFWYLIIIDALSKWVEVFPTKSASSEFVLDKLVECISRFGLFDELVSDNGTQFLASDVQAFLKSNGIVHKLTSPGHPATNGEAENMVKTFKSSLLKSLASDGKSTKVIIANFLMGYRKSIHCTTRLSPCQMMLGRDIKTSLDLLKPCRTKDETRVEGEAKRNILDKQESQVRNFHGSREAEFAVGDRVVSRDYSNPNKPTWTSAIVTERLGPRNYRVRMVKSNRVIKRHLNQLRRDYRDSVQEMVTPAAQSTQAKKTPTSSFGRCSVPLKRSVDISEAADVSQETDDEADTLGLEFLFSDYNDEGDSENRVSDTNVAISGDDHVGSEESRCLDDTGEMVRDQQPVASLPTTETARNGEFDSSEDEDLELVVSGFERGFWRLRDGLGRMFKK